MSEERTLVVVPTDGELQNLVSALHEAGAPSQASALGRLTVFDVAALSLVVAPGGLGKAQFAVQTQHLLSTGAWQLVVCAGAAGALSDDITIGDVVVGTETVEHDIRKVSRRMLPRFAGDERVLDICRGATSFARGVRVHYGAIASGDEDIVSANRRSELRAETRAIAVAWEGAGAARACLFSGTRFVEIRGIVDVANEDGPRDFAANLAASMQNVARVVAELSLMFVTPR
jgi:adenosylhomocysteine nucleosidase